MVVSKFLDNDTKCGGELEEGIYPNLLLQLEKIFR